jgi:hypothetical protein
MATSVRSPLRKQSGDRTSVAGPPSPPLLKARLKIPGVVASAVIDRRRAHCFEQRR